MTDMREMMLDALVDAEAGLEFAINVDCHCSKGGGFVCTPHAALENVRAAIAAAKEAGVTA